MQLHVHVYIRVGAMTVVMMDCGRGSVSQKKCCKHHRDVAVFKQFCSQQTESMSWPQSHPISACARWESDYAFMPPSCCAPASVRPVVCTGRAVALTHDALYALLCAVEVRHSLQQPLRTLASLPPRVPRAPRQELHRHPRHSS